MCIRDRYTLAEFIENGSFEKHINRLRNYYQNKRDLILQALEKKPLGDYVTIEEEEAGVHFLMHLCTDQKEEKIVTQAKSRGVKLKPLSGYYADTAEAAKQENTYVMNYSSIDPAAMERAAGVPVSYTHLGKNSVSLPASKILIWKGNSSQSKCISAN